MKAIEVSVIMPIYNGERYLSEAIRSILNQTFGNFELLIIDDGSTDNSSKLITQYRDPRIRYIHHEKNRGLIDTLNHGIAEARHELIARHDQDDIAYPERLQCQTDFMVQHPEVGVCGSGAFLLENGQRTTKIVFPASDSLIRWALPFYNPLIHPSIIYRRSVVRLISGYSTAANYSEDYDLWWRILPHTKFYNIQRPLMDLRKHQTNMTITKQEYHIQQTTNLTKKYVDRALSRDVPVDLIRWLRSFPVQSKHQHGRVRLILNLYNAFMSHNTVSPADWTRVTANAGVWMMRALKGDMRSWGNDVFNTE